MRAVSEAPSAHKDDHIKGFEDIAEEACWLQQIWATEIEKAWTTSCIALHRMDGMEMQAARCSRRTHLLLLTAAQPGLHKLERATVPKFSFQAELTMTRI